MFEGGVNPNIAVKTIGVFTSPCSTFGFSFGFGNYKITGVSIELRGPDKKKVHNQPGSDGTVMYNHMYAIALTAGMSYVDNSKLEEIRGGIPRKLFPLNYVYNDDIPNGYYMLKLDHCYPFYC